MRRIVVVVLLLLSSSLVTLIPEAEAAPDISVTNSDISLSDPAPTEGDLVQVTATIANSATPGAWGTVRFTEVSQLAVIVFHEETLFFDATSSVQIVGTWVARGGLRTLAVEIVDVIPADAFPSNNRAEITVDAEDREVVIKFDETHLPGYMTDPNAQGSYDRGGYTAFRDLLDDSGWEVDRLAYGSTLSAAALVGTDALIIQSGVGGGTSTYSVADSQIIGNYVRDGHGLLIITEHTNFADTVRDLLGEFGVALQDVLVADPDNPVENGAGQVAQPEQGDLWVYFAVTGNMIGSHQIVNNISRLETYRTNTIASFPAESSVLFQTSSSAYNYNSPSMELDYQALAVAIDTGPSSGLGRVVIATDSNMFETNEDRDHDGDYDLWDSDNDLLTTNIFHWLAPQPTYDFDIECDGPEILEPGEEGTFTLTVTPSGQGGGIQGNIIRDVAVLELNQVSQHWTAELETPTLVFDQDDYSSKTMTLTVTPGEEADFGDTGIFNVTATSLGAGGITASDLCLASLRISYGVELSVTDPVEVVEPGNRWTSFPVTVVNTGRRLDTFHFSLQSGTEPGWEAFLDTAEVTLSPGAWSTVEVSVNAFAAASDSIFNVTLGAISEGGGVHATDSLTLTALYDPSYAIYLFANRTEAETDPDTAAEFMLTVVNAWPGDVNLELDIFGLGGGWIGALGPDNLSLPDLSGRGQAQVLVSITPPPEALAHTVGIAEVVVSDHNLGSGVLAVYNELRLTTRVRQVYDLGLELSLDSLVLSPADHVDLALTVVNRGNGPDTISLNHDLPAWNVTFSSSTFTLSVGETRLIPLSLVLPPDAAAGDYQWRVIAASEDGTLNHTLTAVSVLQYANHSLVVAPNLIILGPGEVAAASITIQNTGNGNDHFLASLEQVSPMVLSWIRLVPSPATPLMSPGSSSTISMIIEVPAEVTPEDHEFLLRTLSSFDPLVSEALDFTLSVQSPDLVIHDVNIQVEGEQLLLLVEVGNAGNVLARDVIVQVTPSLSDGPVVEERFLALAPGSSALAVIPWEPPGDGEAVQILVDPLDAVDEGNESNNEMFLFVAGVGEAAEAAGQSGGLGLGLMPIWMALAAFFLVALHQSRAARRRRQGRRRQASSRLELIDEDPF